MQNRFTMTRSVTGNKIVERGMEKDFSWKNSAKLYEELYENM